MQSINSNRRAPSRDIAAGFAHWNRIRHLASGGRFLKATHTCVSGGRENFHRPPFSFLERDWCMLGPQARLLAELHPIPLRMGVPGARKARRQCACSISLPNQGIILTYWASQARRPTRSNGTNAQCHIHSLSPRNIFQTSLTLPNDSCPAYPSSWITVICVGLMFMLL